MRTTFAGCNLIGIEAAGQRWQFRATDTVSVVRLTLAGWVQIELFAQEVKTGMYLVQDGKLLEVTRV